MTKELYILDQLEEVRQKAAERPAEYPPDYIARLCAAIVAKEFGYNSRIEWTEELKKDSESNYHKRYFGDLSEFHI